MLTNKQKLNKRISSTVTVVENKKETSSGRQGVGTGATGAWEGGDRKGSSQQKLAQAQQVCSCLGPAATEAGCLGLRLVWVSLTLNYLLSSAHYSLKGDLADLSELPSRLKAESAVTARAAFSPCPDMRTSSDLLANQI